MFEYLVTSKARRRLLTLLWKGETGSASVLAKRAKLAFAGAHRELTAMRGLGLVTVAREGSSVIYRANQKHPLAETLQKLIESSRASGPLDAEVRGRLQYLGAPIFGTPVLAEDVEQALVQGAALARQDSTVARVLPLCFYRAVVQGKLDLERLLHAAQEADEKQTVGFFLELTGMVSKDMRLKRWSARFHDKRRGKVLHAFFPERSEFERELAERDNPPVARRWGWRMNMGLDSFESMFVKHA